MRNGLCPAKKNAMIRNLISKLCTAVLCLVAASSCNEIKSELSKIEGSTGTQGKPYEVLVVCNMPEWNGPVGEQLRAQLSRPIEGPMQSDPCFDLMHITEANYKGIMLSYRNIILLDIDAKHTKSSLMMQYNVYATPQLILTIKSPSVQAAADYLQQNSHLLPSMLEKAERDRTVALARKHHNATLSQLIELEFGMRLTVPEGYTLRAQNDDFLWASYEFPNASQGFFIYSYDPKTMRNLTPVAARNLFARRIPGPSDGSYMTTVTKIPTATGDEYTPLEPEMREMTVNGRKWLEMRGLWELENDFMGGPFVSYTTYNEAKGRMVVIDCYVYSPDKTVGKRRFLRPLEHLVWLADFASPTPTK